MDTSPTEFVRFQIERLDGSVINDRYIVSGRLIEITSDALLFTFDVACSGIMGTIERVSAHITQADTGPVLSIRGVLSTKPTPNECYHGISNQGEHHESDCAEAEGGIDDTGTSGR